MKNKIVIYSLLGFILNACGTQTKLSNLHYKKYEVLSLNSTESDELLDYGAAIIPLEKASVAKDSPTLFFNLPDSLAHTYVKAMAEKAKSSDELYEILQKPIVAVPKNQKALATNFNEIPVRIFLGHAKNYYKLGNSDYNKAEFLNPNTRLAHLNTILTIIDPEDKLEILKIDKLENELEEINLGTLKRNQQVSFNSKLTGQYGLMNSGTTSINSTVGDVRDFGNSTIRTVYDEEGNPLAIVNKNDNNSNNFENVNGSIGEKSFNMGLAGELGYLNNEQLEELLNLKPKRLKTGFIFDKSKILLSQQAAPLVDIFNNNVITATLISRGYEDQKVTTFSGLFKSQLPQNASEITINKRMVKIIPCEDLPENICLKLNWSGVIRAVKNSTKTNSAEFDDRVIYYEFQGENEQDLNIDLSPYCKKLYRIVVSIHNKKYVLSDGKELLFLEEEMDEIMLWIKRIIENPNQFDLNSEKFDLFFKNGVDKLALVGRKIADDQKNKLKNLHPSFEEYTWVSPPPESEND